MRDPELQTSRDQLQLQLKDSASLLFDLQVSQDISTSAASALIIIVYPTNSFVAC